MTKFNIYLNDDIIDRIHANTAAEAIDLFAAIVSGYDTFSEMMRSTYFSSKYLGAFAA